MPMSYRDYVGSPHVAYVDFRVNGVSVTKRAGKPYSFQRFMFTYRGDESADFELELFDPEWTDLETMLTQNPKNITFDFGYEPPIPDTVNSLKWHGQLTSVLPSFTQDGIYLSVKGTSNLANANLIKECEVWPSARNFGEDNYRRISEYVEEIAKRRGWDTEIDKTKEIKVTDSFAGTEKVNMRFVQQRMTDLQFIRNILRPHAVREKDNVSGYKVYFEFKDGKKVLHFHPPRTENPPGRVFVFMRDKDSEVIDFKVNMKGQELLGMMGTLSVAAPLVDSTNGIEKTVYMNNKKTKEKTYLAPYQIKAPLDITEYPTIHAFPMVTRLPSQNEEVAEAKARANYYFAFYAPVTAQLTIMGDAREELMPDHVVTVLVMTNRGEKHYTSGNYIIVNRTDEVANGSWTTTLQLQRNGSIVDTGGERTVGMPNVRK